MGAVLSLLVGVVIVVVLSVVLTALFASNDRRTGAQLVMTWVAVLVRGYPNDPPAAGTSALPPAPPPDPATSVPPQSDAA